jgi:hypothetical protein
MPLAAIRLSNVLDTRLVLIELGSGTTSDQIHEVVKQLARLSDPFQGICENREPKQSMTPHRFSSFARVDCCNCWQADLVARLSEIDMRVAIFRRGPLLRTV